MKKRNWLSADELAKKFRIKSTVQPSLNGEVSKGLTTQQKIVFGGVVIVGSISLIYVIYYFLKQRAEKKKNAELAEKNRKANELLKERMDNYFNENNHRLRQRVYR